jgi:hypothetical protein
VSAGPSITTRPAGYRWTILAVAAILAFVAEFVRVGSDCEWLVALGDHIRSTGHIPDGVPYAVAPSSHWHNTLVAAELILSVVQALGVRALGVLQLVAVGACLLILDRDARRRGAGDAGVALALGLTSAGALTFFVIVRVSLFSLVAFAVLVAILRAQHERPTRAIWWVPVLVCAWTNLHGAVLAGVAVTGVHLAFSRLRSRPAETVAVGLATLAALFVTPAGVDTAAYYWNALHNRAAARGLGMWARLSPERPLDVILMICAAALLVLIVRAARRRTIVLPVWEWLVLAALVLACVQSARNGMLLLLFATGPAAIALTRAAAPRGARNRRGALVAAAIAAVVAAGVLAVRPGTVGAATSSTVDEIARATAGHTVLVPSPLAEALAVRGVRLWLANPLDAFSPADQDGYLDFVENGRVDAALLGHDIDAVVVADGSDQARAIETVGGFREVTRAGSWVVYLRH